MAFHSLRIRRAAVLVLSLSALVLALVAPSAWAAAKGQPDPGFGSGGFTGLGNDTKLLGVAVQPDGKAVAVGETGLDGNAARVLVVRFNANGSRDTSFAGGQYAGPVGTVGHGVAIQGDGKVVVAGGVTDGSGSAKAGMFVLRLNSNGSPDGSFGAGGYAGALGGSFHGVANAVAIQSDGRIVAAGSAEAGGYPRVGLARFNSNGSPDGSFGFGGVAIVDLGRFSIANGVAIQGDGKIVVGGTQRNDLQTTSALAARFNPNGSTDGSFSNGIFLQQYAQGAGFSGFNAVALQPDGKVVLAGTAFSGSSANALIVRLTSGGTPDSSFGGGSGVARVPAGSGASYTQGSPPGAFGVVVSAGEIFAAGYANNGLNYLALWGLTGSGAPDGGFGSGGSTFLPVGSRNAEIGGLAVAPGGNLVVAGDISAPFSPTNGFAGRFGGPFVPLPTPPPPPGPPRLSVSAPIFSSYPLSSVSRYGVRLRVSCNQACSVRESMSVSYSVARHLRLASSRSRHRSVTIGTGSGRLTRAGRVYVRLRLTSRARHALAHQRYVTTRIYTTVTAGSQSRRTSRSVQLVPTLSVSAPVSRTYRIGSISRSGLRVRIGTNQSCSVRGVLTVTYATARRLHLIGVRRSHAAVTIGTAHMNLRRRARAYLVLRLYSRVRRALAHQRSVTARLSITVTKGSQTRRINRTVALRR